MSKILDWIKKHVWQTILIGFGLFFAPLFLVHVAYKIPAISPWFASTWEAGELITYIAGFEAFLGTVVLGAVAVRQNDKSNELNARMIKNEELHGTFERQPNLVIRNSKIQPFINKHKVSFPSYIFIPRDCNQHEYLSSDDMFQVSFELLNDSNTYASIMILQMDLRIFNSPDINSFIKSIIFDKYLYDECVSIYNIAPQKTTIIRFLVKKELLFNPLSKIINLNFRISNSIGEIYIESISLTTRNSADTPLLEVFSHIITPTNDSII